MILCTIQHIGLVLSFPACTVNLLLTALDRIFDQLDLPKEDTAFPHGNALRKASVAFLTKQSYKRTDGKNA